MGFYLFKLDRVLVRRRRGNIPDSDIVTFHILVNNVDRGHGSGLLPAVANNSTHLLDDRGTDSGDYAYPAKNLLNMTRSWVAGPFEIRPTDGVAVVYSGVNTSDSGLSSLPHQDRDRLQLDILNKVTRIAVGALLGAGLGEVIGRAFSEAFNRYFSDPIGDLIGYAPQGPCNGPIFSDVVHFTGSGLDQSQFVPRPSSTFPAVSFTRSYTDEATHNRDICGDIAETDVTFSVFRVPFISLNYWMSSRFPGRAPSAGLRQLGRPGTTISIKSLFGVLP